MNTPVVDACVFEAPEQPNTAAHRRVPRYRTNFWLSVRDCRKGNLRAHCFVIAEGGLGASLPEVIEVGSAVQLRFLLPTHPDPTLMNVGAMVRNQLHQHHGFEFLSLSEDQRWSLRQFCDQLASEQSRQEFVCAHV